MWSFEGAPHTLLGTKQVRCLLRRLSGLPDLLCLRLQGYVSC